MAPVFDAYIIVDWSAAATPVTGANSIWIGVRSRNKRSFDSFNPDTRSKARDLLYRLASDFTRRGKRLLIGFDFALGYPAGTAGALGLETRDTPPWRAMYEFLTANLCDQENNANDRFALAARMNAAITGGPHPFWGTPPAQVGTTLATRKGDFSRRGSLPEHRRAEGWIRETFTARPKSVWQLLGAGAVGSQSLLGIPTVADLRARVSGARIWPFETGLANMTEKALSNTSCILAEVYPSTLPIRFDPGQIRDLEQVRAVSKRFESLDSTGILSNAFDLPDSISDREIHKIIAEEGWILAK